MSDFRLALDQARADAAAVERLNFALESYPNDRKLAVSLLSAQKRAYQSQETLAKYAGHEHIDIVSYRIVRLQNNYPVLAIAESVASFQKAVVGVADALENGPKNRARYSAEIQRLAELEFAYSFPGSTGIVFCIPNERTLLDGGRFDEISKAISNFLSITDEDEARDASRHLGLAAIGQLYDWVDRNAAWENSVDYIWTRSNKEKSGEFIDRAKFQGLKEVLLSALDPSTEELRVRGKLVGLDVETRRFHFIDDNDHDISGKLDQAFAQANAVVGATARYVATIIETEVRFATGKIERTYRLAELAEA